MDTTKQFFSTRYAKQDPLINRRSSSIFRVNRNVRIKDEELPFTKAIKKIKSPPNELSSISRAPDILQKTYYKALPLNRNPLSKISTQPTLATFNPTLDKSPTTKYCHYNEQYLHSLNKLNQMEESLNQDIAKSIKRTASVGDYHKTSGAFFISKTSQNYSNTIEALSNYEKAKVEELDLWYKRKIEKSLKNVKGDKLFSIQVENQDMDPETLLKDRLIQTGEVQEILSATNQQLKSVLKQKAEMFQPGKSLDFRNKNDKIFQKGSKKFSNLQKVTNFIKSRDYTRLLGQDGKPIIEIQDEDQDMEEKSVDKEDQPLEEQILKPLKKKELWEMKEKSTKLEIQMQYQISKLEDEISSLKTQLEWTRRDNCLLGERLKKKSTKRILKNGFTIEPLQPDSAKLRQSPGASSINSQSPGLLRGASRINDFMKKQGKKDSFKEKHERHIQKINNMKSLQDENNERITDIENKLRKLRLELDEAKYKQVEHYKQLLQTGLDARKDGLIWIIKTLWLLKKDIQIQCMPRFLDSESIRFLLEYAKLDIKRNELHTVLKEMKFKAKEKRLNDVFKLKMTMQQSNMSPRAKPGSPIGRRQLSVFNQPNSGTSKMNKSLQRKNLFSLKSKEEILKQAKEQLHEMSQTIQAVNLTQDDPEELEILLQLQQEEESEEYESDDELADILPQFRKHKDSILQRQNTLIKVEKIDQQAKSQNEQEALDQKSKYVEKEYNTLKNKMRVMKNYQLDRIGREFLLNNYEKRFKVCQEIVLAAIVGEDKAKAAAANQVKKQEEYKRIIEKNRTFTFASLRQSNLPAQRITINTLKQ